MKNLFALLLLGLFTITAFNSCEKAPPVFSIGYDGDLYEGESICFEASSTGYDNYAWNFGNGRYGGGSSYCNTYATAGTYTVELTVTSGGKNYTSTEEITIKSKPRKIKIKKITLTNVDYQSNWDPHDSSGPDAYLTITESTLSNTGTWSKIEHYKSPIIQNVTANSLPLVYTPNIELSSGISYDIALYDEDGTSDHTMALGAYIPSLARAFPFTDTNITLDFTFDSAKGSVEIEYIY